MGRTRVETGDHVIGRGTSSITGRRVHGKYGVVADVRDFMGDDVVTVAWSDGTEDDVRQDEVSGTQEGTFSQRAPREPSAAEIKAAAKAAKQRAKEEARRARQQKVDERRNKRHGVG